MKIIFECNLEEIPSNIGIAKALIETHLNVHDLREISLYLSIYCNEHLFDTVAEEGGAE